MKLYQYIRSLRNAIIWIIFGGMWGVLYAQEYTFREYSIAQGLPQSQIFAKAVVEAHDGRIWVGTNGGGLCRLDGEYFKVYSKEDGLPSNQIWSVLEDHKKNIWFMTFNRGLVRFDGKNFETHIDSSNVLQNGVTSIIFQDRHHTIWIRNFGNNSINSLFIKKENQKLQNYSLHDPIFKNIVLQRILLDADKNIVICTNKGVFVFDGKRFVPKQFHNEGSLKGANYQIMHIDQHNTYWINAFGGDNQRVETIGFFAYNGKNFTSIPLPDFFSNNLSNGAVSSDRRGRIWIASGISPDFLIYEKGVFRHFSSKNGFPGVGVSDFIEDSEGNMWLATNGSGLLKFPEEYFDNITAANGLPERIIFGIYEDSKGLFWLGLPSLGFCTWDGTKVDYPKAAHNWTFGRVNTFIEYDNKMLIGTANGIFIYDGINVEPANTLLGLPQIPVGKLIREGNYIWICSTGAGIFCFDTISKKITTQYSFAKANSNAADFIRSMTKTQDGTIYVGSANGMHVIKGKEIKTLTQKDGMSGDLILQLAVDKYDRVWAVCYDGKLSCYDGKKFRNYGKKDGISADLMYSIAIDKEQNIWLGTQEGINRIKVDEKGTIQQISIYDKNYGLASNEMNGNSILIDRQHNIWFGHLLGVSRLNLQNLPKNNFPPKTYLQRIDFYLQKTNWADSVYWQYYDSLSINDHLPMGLSLPKNKNNLTFSFTSQSHHVPKKIRYQWKLENFDTDWQPITDKTEASYSGLPPQQYTFKVRSMNSDGVWGKPTEYNFEIQPAFWDRLWVRISGFGFFLGLVYLGMKWRIRSIEASKKYLEKVVEERTKEISLHLNQIVLQSKEIEQQKMAIEQAYTEINEQNHNITASINYAHRIQQAILPVAQRIKQCFPDMFVLYKPRDIVSGDFYWFAETPDKVVIAAADCTGHGVPGALMSMAGDAYLNLIVNALQIYSPSQILKELDERIRHALKQEDNYNRDGMDIALCVVDKDEKTLTYSGANNPLVYIVDGEMHFVKAVKQPIGGALSARGKVFVETTLHIKTNMRFYLYSDGYQDQFGGKENKKLGSKHFRELLFATQADSMEEQKRKLDTFFENWRGKEWQIDDVLVLGVRITF